MPHILLKIIANDLQQEELISFLSDFNPTGFEQTENELLAYFDASQFDKEAIEAIVSGYEHSIQDIEEKNWNEEWERNFQPVVVDTFCGVRAHFHEPLTAVEHEIIITPKMSFGTGHHATTYMMIQQMQQINFTGKKVFDFGTGTGILAILAEKLGAANIIAIDVDDWSIENAKENSKLNNCSNISITLSSQIPDEQFDIVLANINRNVILQYSQELDKVVNKHGILVVSGILQVDKEDITRTFISAGFALVSSLTRGEWISLMFINSNE